MSSARSKPLGQKVIRILPVWHVGTLIGTTCSPGSAYSFEFARLHKYEKFEILDQVCYHPNC